MDNTQRGKYQFLKTQFAPKIKEALGGSDRSAAAWLSGTVDHMNAGDIFDKFAAIDPSAHEKKKPHRYLNWIIQAYLQSHKDGAQPILAEDFYKITKALGVFTKHQNKLSPQERDIGRYSYDDLIDKTRSLEGVEVVSLSALNRAAKQDIYDQSIVLYKGDAGMVVTPLTMKAAQFWGKGTQWCTSAAESGNNFFEYHKKDPLIIFMPKNSPHKYQLHRKTKSLMDENDRQVNSAPRELQHLMDKCDISTLENGEEHAFDSCSTDFKDKDSVLRTVTQNGWALQYADESLKKNKDIVLATVTQDGRALQYADESLKKNKDIALAAVLQNGWALRFADESLRKNKEIALAAVLQNGWALPFADESLRKNKEIALAAVMQDGWALQYADESLKKNKEIVLAAVMQNGRALAYADEGLKNDKDFMLTAVTHSGIALAYADESLKKDKEIVLAAVTQTGWALAYADESLKKDKDFMLAAVTQNGLALEDTDESLRKDPGIIERANFHGRDLEVIIMQEYWHLIKPEKKLALYHEYAAENGAAAAYCFAPDCGVDLDEIAVIETLKSLPADDETLKMKAYLIPPLARKETFEMNVAEALEYFKTGPKPQPKPQPKSQLKPQEQQAQSVLQYA